MTMHLLDTNVCIALINGRDLGVRRRFERAVASGGIMLLSSIVAFELWYGVEKSQRKESNVQRLEVFLSGPMEWMPFDDQDARAAAAIRAELEKIGKPIGAYDLLLAGQARHRGATLVTSNTSAFSRVSGLKWKDWATPRRR